MVGPSATRRFFLFAVALVAAALADPAVESIANAGFLGGRYRDDNHLSVVPALVVGGALLLLIVAGRCRAVWRSSVASRDWLMDAANSFSDRSPLADLPRVYLVQMAALFVMENAEQFAVGGRPSGGIAWLGGPILFSLLFHAVVGAGCLYALGSFMRALVRTFASLLRTALASAWLAVARESGRRRLVAWETPSLRSQRTRVHETGGRAPPLLPMHA